MRGRYEAGKRGAREVQDRQVKGRYESGKRGVRQVRGR